MKNAHIWNYRRKRRISVAVSIIDAGTSLRIISHPPAASPPLSKSTLSILPCCAGVSYPHSPVCRLCAYTCRFVSQEEDKTKVGEMEGEIAVLKRTVEQFKAGQD